MLQTEPPLFEPYTEDFEDELTDWTLGSVFSIGNGQLQATTWSASQTAVYNQPFAGTYTYRLDIMPPATSTNWNATRILFNMQDQDHYYELRIGNSILEDNGVELLKVDGGSESLLGTYGTYPIGGKKTTVQITYELSGHISVKALQGEVLTTLFDRVEDASFEPGKIGVGVRSSNLTVDDVLVVSGIAPDPQPPEQEPLDPLPTMEEGNFALDGSMIRTPDGGPFVMKGINVNGPRWPWTRDTIQDVGLIADVWKFNAVRVNMFPRLEQYNLNGNLDLDGIVAAFTSRRVVTVLENHDFTGRYPKPEPYTDPNGDNYPSLEQTKQYWVELANKYKDNPYVWFNVLNEPGKDGLSNSESITRWRDVHDELIAAIRSTGAQNIIVVDGHDFGQEGGYRTGDAESAILTEGPYLAQKYANLVFSLHLYELWAEGDERLEAYYNRAKQLGLPLFIGEYGARDNQTKTVTAAMFNTSVPAEIGRVAWSWESGDAFDLTTGTSQGGGYEIDRADGTKPGNLSWMGNLIWDDNHGALTVPVEVQTPLIVNGGFEDGLNGWQNWSNGAINATNPHSGTNSFRINAGSDGGGGQFVTGLRPDTTYKLVVWGRNDAEPASPADVGLKYQPANDAAFIQHMVSFTETDWTRKELVFRTGPSVIPGSMIFIWKSDAGHAFDADDITLTETDELPEEDGPSFEATETIVTDLQGNAIPQLRPGAYVRTSLTLTNKSGSEKQAEVLIGIYDEDNRLVGMQAVKQSVAGGRDETVELAFRLPDAEGQLRMTTHVWNSLTGMQPLLADDGQSAEAPEPDIAIDVAGETATLSGSIADGARTFTLQVWDPLGDLTYLGETVIAEDGSFSVEVKLDPDQEGQYVAKFGMQGLSEPFVKSFDVSIPSLEELEALVRQYAKSGQLKRPLELQLLAVLQAAEAFLDKSEHARSAQSMKLFAELVKHPRNARWIDEPARQHLTQYAETLISRWSS